MDELNEQVDAGTGAAPEGAGTDQVASSAATTETTPQISEEVQALIDQRAKEAAEKVKAEYEGKDGHLARLKSAKDKEVARLKRQLREGQQSKVKEAKELIESNPDQAAQILLSLAEEQDQQIEQDSAHEQLVEWQHKILADLGADPAEDEEAAELAAEWGPKILEDPEKSYDFQQEAARLQLAREREATKTANRELKELKESLPETVKAEVTRALVSAGIVPEPTDEGGAPPKEKDWRGKSEGQLRKEGLAERRKRPIART